MNDFKILIFGDLSLGSLYNRSLRGLVRVLQRLDFDPATVRVIPVSGSHDYMDPKDDWLHPFVYGDWEDADRMISVAHLPAIGAGAFRSGSKKKRFYNIAYCHFQATDAVPRSFDEVWSATTFGGDWGTISVPPATAANIAAVADVVAARLEFAAATLRQEPKP